MLGRVGGVFWVKGPTILEPALTVHKIARVLPAFTPADEECLEYTAVCGRTGQSWCSRDMGVSETCVAENEDQRPAGAIPCPICFPSKDVEEGEVIHNCGETCPECGSKDVDAFDIVDRAFSIHYVDDWASFKCNACGHTWAGQYGYKGLA